MPDMTYNTVVFVGSQLEIEDLCRFFSDTDGEMDFNRISPVPHQVVTNGHDSVREWKRDNWGVTWWENMNRTLIVGPKFSMLEFSFNTPWYPPTRVLDSLFGMFPNLRVLHRVTIENEEDETIVVRRDPETGFQRCLEEFGSFSDDPRKRTLVVLDDYIEDLMSDEGWSIPSEIVGVTVDRIEQRRKGLLNRI